MEHTPGPWKVQKPPHPAGITSGLMQKNPGAIQIVSYGTIWGFGVDIAALGEGEEKEANACLISAAPDLLRIVKEVLTVLRLDAMPSEQWVLKAETVIAKAQGVNAQC